VAGEPELLLLPEPREVGQTYIHDGHTFVVNPFQFAGFETLGWFEIRSIPLRIATPVAS
jgi:hypothetical protein